MYFVNKSSYVCISHIILTGTTNAVSFCTSAWRCTSSFFAFIFSITCAILKNGKITFSFKLRKYQILLQTYFIVICYTRIICEFDDVENPHILRKELQWNEWVREILGDIVTYVFEFFLISLLLHMRKKIQIRSTKR